MAPAFAGPVFAPGQKLFVIKTEHFDIIFSDKSRESALRLSTMAESVFDEVTDKLDTRPSGRIPVTITPDIGSFNGYCSLFPYPHIVLYDTSLDPGWTSFRDNFRSLFLHEFTHAASLQIRAPWASFFSGLFGSWVLPGLLNTPEFMVEGVTVSFESAEPPGGRANDPLVKERVRQDILENRFKSPIECSGLYDEYPSGNLFYEYGGLFNAYIQKTYGMEKYAELWKAMGNIVLSGSLDPYEKGFYKVFESSYGLPFLEAWADFRNSLELSGVDKAPEVLGPDGLSDIEGGLAGNESGLFWVEARSGRAVRLDLATGKASSLFDAGTGDSICDASPDATARSGLILVSRALALPDGRDRVETRAYDLGRGSFLAEPCVPGMREARFFRTGLVGIVPKLHNTDLVLAEGGKSRVLLAGSDTVMFSSPAVLDDRRIALIVAVGGARSIGILNVDSGKLSLLRPREEDAQLLTYVRQLSAAGGKLYFNYDSDDRFYKLGTLDLSESLPAIRVDTKDYSGGVFSPREAGGRIYYIGRFSEGCKICRYPGEAAEAGERAVASSLEDFDPSVPGDEVKESIAKAEGETKVEAYSPLSYANPFDMWFLYPDLSNIDRSFRLFGLFVMQDPIDANTVNLLAGYDCDYPFADARITWVNASLPILFTTSLGDRLVYGAEGAPERQSSASLDAKLRLPLYPGERALVFGLGGEALSRAEGEEGSPYGWDRSGRNATASAYTGWEGILSGSAKDSGRGFDILSYHDLDIASREYKTEAHLAAAIESPSLRLDLWGAWASEPILRLDSTSSVFSSDRRPAYAEYESLREGEAEKLFEGALSFRLADQAIHANLLDLYFNRILVDLGCRGAYFRGEALSSAFARISLDIGAARGMAAGVLRLFAEGFERFSGRDSDSAFGWRLGIGASTDAMGGIKIAPML